MFTHLGLFFWSIATRRFRMASFRSSMLAVWSSSFCIFGSKETFLGWKEVAHFLKCMVLQHLDVLNQHFISKFCFPINSQATVGNSNFLKLVRICKKDLHYRLGHTGKLKERQNFNCCSNIQHIYFIRTQRLDVAFI